MCRLYANTAAAAKSLQSCPTLCDPIDGSPSGSPVPGILQARILEWIAIYSSNAWKRKVKVKSFSHVQLVATAWTAAHQAPPSMGFSRQEYWSGVPLPCVFPLDLLVFLSWSWQDHTQTRLLVSERGGETCKEEPSHPELSWDKLKANHA